MHTNSKKKFSLKDELFNPVKVEKIALEIQTIYPLFDKNSFKKTTLDKFPQLQLKERISHIATTLHIYLPSNYKKALSILLDSLPQALDTKKTDNDFGDFIYATYAEFVRIYGCTKESINTSLDALKTISQRFSVEFAIRDFINNFPMQTLQMLEECSLSSNYHLRRLASEGLRPNLPWGKKITIDYHTPLLYLEKLYYDPTRYVVRSVANHLNDISKIDSTLVISTLNQWKASKKQKSQEMEYLITHALRTLLKNGDKQALELLGYTTNPSIEVSDFTLSHKSIKIGESLELEFAITATQKSQLLINYTLGFRTKSGKLSPKVYKIKKLTLQKDESITLYKKHLFKPAMSTRTFYSGEQQLLLQINGKVYANETFILKDK